MDNRTKRSSGNFRRLQRDSRGSYFIRLPRQIVEALGWRPGDVFEVRLLGRDRVELKRVKV